MILIPPHAVIFMFDAPSLTNAPTITNPPKAIISEYWNKVTKRKIVQLTSNQLEIPQ